MKSHKGASQGERKSGQFAFGSWPVLRDGENNLDSKGPALWRGSGLARSPEKMPAFRQVRGRWVGCNQSSVGSMMVMAGCGSSMSSAPQVAINLMSLAARLSLRT